MPSDRISVAGWARVVEFANRLVERGDVPSLSLAVGGKTGAPRLHAAGVVSTSNSVPVNDRTIFLTASLTKPLVGLAILKLIERGQLTLGDRVTDFFPDFGRNGKYGVEIRHLLTHTSGLPDMLPNNQELRQQHAPLEQFVAAVCQCELAFAPGRAVQYQSMGFVMLGAIVQQLAGMPLAQFLAEEFLIPLEMHRTVLGVPQSWYEGDPPLAASIAEVRVPETQVHGDDWNWNSRYWQELGAPWGGLMSTATDLAVLARMLLNSGITPSGGRLLSPASIAAATRNQLAAAKDLQEDERRCRPWGLGWRLQWPNHSANFGDLLSPATYGHWGATGTVLWIDPHREQYAVILSTQPQDPAGSQLARLSNLLAAAWS